MLVFSMFCWLIRCVFACNHLRTPVNEGKCYCPDCGRGLVYHWVILRCGACHSQLDGRTVLRQVLPIQRCCPQCGSCAPLLERLDSPSWFQLRRAQLMVQEEESYVLSRFGWNLHSAGTVLRRKFCDALALLETGPTVEPALACLPIDTGR